jgi:hypothetical protein
MLQTLTPREDSTRKSLHGTRSILDSLNSPDEMLRYVYLYFILVLEPWYWEERYYIHTKTKTKLYDKRILYIISCAVFWHDIYHDWLRLFWISYKGLFKRYGPKGLGCFEIHNSIIFVKEKELGQIQQFKQVLKIADAFFDRFFF